MVMKQAAPYIAEGLVAVCKDLVLNYVHEKLLRPIPVVYPYRDESPSVPETCPYCAMAKHLAVAKSYVRRAKHSTAFLPIYQQLAFTEIRQAADIAQGLRPDFDARVSRLGHQIIGIEMQLAKPLRPSALTQVCESIDIVLDLDFDLAEKFNSGARHGDELAADMEQRVKVMDDNIIEGEVSVIGE